MAIRPYIGAGGVSGAGFQVGDTFSAGTKDLAEAARDAAITGSLLDRYKKNEFLVVRLQWQPNEIAYTSYVNNAWKDVTGLVTGPTGTAANLANLTQNYIPIKGSSDTEFEDSGVKYNPVTKNMEFRDGVKIPPGSIDYGDMGIQSQNGPQPMFTSKVTGKRYLTAFQEINSTGSAFAWVRDMEAETAYVVNVDKTSQIDISSKISFDITTTETEQINVLTFYIPSSVEIKNLRVRILSKTTGKSIYFHPDEFSWNDGKNGVNVLPYPGEHQLDIDIIQSPIAFLIGQELTIEIVADEGKLLGSSSGVPSLDIKRQIFRRDSIVTSRKSPDDFQSVSAVDDHTLRFIRRDGSPVDVSLSGASDTTPYIDYFRIKDQPETVSDGYSLSGSKTFEYKVEHADQVVGNLFLKQGSTTLRNNVSPTATSKTLTLPTTTVMSVGDTITFSLSGEDALSGKFSKTFNIKCVADDEMFYYGLSPTTNPNSISLSVLNKQEITRGDFDFTVGPTESGKYIILLSPSDHDLTKLINSGVGVDVLSSYTKHTKSRTINGVEYDAYTFGPVNDGFTQTYRATFE